MSFFPIEPVPVEPPPEPEREPEPPWSGPPVGEVPVALPVTGLLASSRFAAVVLRSVRVFSNGLELEIQGKLRRADATEEQWDDLQGRFSEYGRSGRRSTGRLRVGVLLADGRRAISAPNAPEPEDDGYRLTRNGGGGTGSDRFHDTDWSFWLWPRPPDGPVTLVVDWLALDLPEQQIEFEGRGISEAAIGVEPIWPDAGTRPAGAQPSWRIRF